MASDGSILSGSVNCVLANSTISYSGAFCLNPNVAIIPSSPAVVFQWKYLEEAIFAVLHKLLLATCEQVQSYGQQTLQTGHHQRGSDFLVFVAFSVARLFLFLSVKQKPPAINNHNPLIRCWLAIKIMMGDIDRTFLPLFMGNVKKQFLFQIRVK